MSGPPARRPATYEDLIAVPEHLVAEIIDGELYTSPRPAVPHAIATHTGDVNAHVEPFAAVELELWRLWGKSAPS